MPSIAKQIENKDVWMETGTVVNRDEDGYIVRTGYGPSNAKRSADCLMTPEVGDRVLMVFDGAESSYIMNVLERADPARPAVIAHDGDTVWQVRGEMKMVADQVNLSGVNGVRVLTDRFDLSCRQAETLFGGLQFKAGRISGQMHTLKIKAQRIERIAETAMERLTRSYRRISDFEDNRIGRMTCWIKGLFAVHSESTSIQSEDRVEVDADQILLG